MIEELVQQFEKEFETADETDVQETEQATDNVETATDTVKDESPNESIESPKSLIATMVERLEEEFMTVESPDDEEESEQDEQEPANESLEDDDVEQVDEQGGQDVSESDEQETDDEQEQADDQDETNSQLDEIVKALEDERKKLEDERQEWQKKIEEAEQRASESERKARQLAMSFLLQSRQDITDIRLVASLIGDVNEIEVGDEETLEQAINKKIDETVRRYPTLVKDGKKEYRTVTTDEGISVQSEIRPIGRATAKAQDEPFNSKAEILAEMKERAESSGNPADRVRYLSKAREWGLL